MAAAPSPLPQPLLLSPEPHLAPQLCREKGTKAHSAPPAQAGAAPSPERPPVMEPGGGFGLLAGPRPDPRPSLPSLGARNDPAPEPKTHPPPSQSPPRRLSRGDTVPEEQSPPRSPQSSVPAAGLRQQGQARPAATTPARPAHQCGALTGRQARGRGAAPGGAAGPGEGGEGGGTGGAEAPGPPPPPLPPRAPTRGHPPAATSGSCAAPPT